MSDYLMRDGAPFGDEGWAHIDGMVVEVVKKNLVGRRFVKMVGPLGWGVEIAPTYRYEPEPDKPLVAETGDYVTLEELGAGFMLKAKHLAVAAASPFGYEMGAVAMAATKLAKAEDDKILGGLMAGVKPEKADWDSEGGPFRAIAKATADLRSAGFDGPYVAVMSPDKFASMAAQMRQGRRELEMVEKLLGAGLFQSTADAVKGKVLVASAQAWNFDMVVGQDVVTAYLGNQGLDHEFKIFETLALRVKRPGSVIVLA